MGASTNHRIIHATQAGGIGGVSRVIQVLAEGQHRVGCRVTVAVPSFFDSPEYRAWFGGASDLVCEPFVSRTESPKLRQFHRMVRWLRSQRADVLHVHSGSNLIHPRLPLAGRLAGIKRIVVTIHHIGDPSEVPRAPMKSAAIVRTVVATTEIMANRLVGMGLPRGKVRTIYPPIPAPTGPKVARADLRSALGVSEGDFVVGGLARFITQGQWDKGQGNLIKAAQRAAREIPNLKLVIAGDGPERPKLEQYVQRECPGLVLFPGLLASVDAFYPALDLFAHLSNQEGFGLVFVEAAHYGVPAIGTRVGGVPVAVEDGVTGWLTEYGDVDGAGQLIIEAFRSGEELGPVGAAARERATRLFAPDPIRDQYFEAYGIGTR